MKQQGFMSDTTPLPCTPIDGEVEGTLGKSDSRQAASTDSYDYRGNPGMLDSGAGCQGIEHLTKGEASMAKGGNGGLGSLFPSHQGGEPATPGPISPRRADGPMSKAGGKAPSYDRTVNTLIKGGERADSDD